MVTDRRDELKSTFKKGKKGLLPFIYRRIYDWQKPKSFISQKTNYGFTETEQSSFEVHGILLDSLPEFFCLAPHLKP